MLRCAFDAYTRQLAVQYSPIPVSLHNPPSGLYSRYPKPSFAGVEQSTDRQWLSKLAGDAVLPRLSLAAKLFRDPPAQPYHPVPAGAVNREQAGLSD